MLHIDDACLCGGTDGKNNKRKQYADNDSNNITKSTAILLCIQCAADVTDDAYPDICVADREKYVWHVGEKPGEPVNERALGTSSSHGLTAARVPIVDGGGARIGRLVVYDIYYYYDYLQCCILLLLLRSDVKT